MRSAAEHKTGMQRSGRSAQEAKRMGCKSPGASVTLHLVAKQQGALEAHGRSNRQLERKFRRGVVDQIVSNTGETKRQQRGAISCPLFAYKMVFPQEKHPIFNAARALDHAIRARSHCSSIQHSSFVESLAF
eukprot:1148659-Pelagomonas_calceolata.AAC.2